MTTITKTFQVALQLMTPFYQKVAEKYKVEMKDLVEL
jgi:cytochrome c551/c552